jgi:hypothetical protein
MQSEDKLAVHFRTNDPAKLLAAYKKVIDDGHVTTWSYDKDGDFTHTAEQWIRKAWLTPSISQGELVFYILGPKEVQITTTVYAIYHGRFIESMLRHCDSLFTSGTASSLPEVGDIIG